MNLKKAKETFEEMAKECGIEIDDLYETMAKRQEKLNFTNDENANRAKADAFKIIKDAKKSILINADGHTLVYGNPVTILSSLCCIIDNLKEDIPEEIIRSSINFVLNNEGDE